MWAVALGIVGGILAALATPAVWADPPSPGSGEAPATHLACPQSMRPGYLSCNAIVRDDGPSHTPSGYGPADRQGAYAPRPAMAGPGGPSRSSTPCRATTSADRWTCRGCRRARTQFTLAPGHSSTVVITLDATAPGTYTGAFDVGNDTPYEVPALPVTLTAR